ncbi:MAG TPA: GFA family protein [Aliidongia sp.]|nr:GFA family protein [Aliidongia sp.]
MIHASCHCGAVRMEIAEAPDHVTDCNCSICRRLGTLWVYYRPDQVRIVPPAGATIAYTHGEASLEFHRCKVCGCITHWEAADKAKATRMGVNARLFDDPADLRDVPVRKFDGAESWTYLG